MGICTLFRFLPCWACYLSRVDVYWDWGVLFSLEVCLHGVEGGGFVEEYHLHGRAYSTGWEGAYYRDNVKAGEAE